MWHKVGMDGKASNVVGTLDGIFKLDWHADARRSGML